MIIMVNYVYQPKTLGDMLAIYVEPFLPATHREEKGRVVAIYHEKTLIGINIFAPLTLLPHLTTGIQRTFSEANVMTIQTLLDEAKIQLMLPKFHSGFVVGQIQQIDSHPEADALFVTQIHLKEKVIQIVTNSSKVKVGDRVVVALPGAMLNDGQVILEGPMLKVQSQGMLTSEKTLGIVPEHQVGVYVLPEHTTIGKDFYAQ